VLIADGLRTRGSATTTIGIGADYDDSLLTVIAAHTGGNQHHVDEADRIGPILAEELEDLVELYAQNVTLRFAPSAGVASTHSLNGYPTVAHDGGFSVLCGDIVAGDERSVLIEFVCKPGAGPQQIATLVLQKGIMMMNNNTDARKRAELRIELREREVAVETPNRGPLVFRAKSNGRRSEY